MHRRWNSLRVFSALVLVSVAVIGCQRKVDTSPESGGRVEIRTQAFTGEWEVTRIALDVQPANVQQDLTYNANGSFTGSLTVPAGVQVFTARAWTGTVGSEVQVGVGSASVTVVAGQTVGVFLRLLDTTGVKPKPDFGPIILSLVASTIHPLAGQAVTLTATAVDPGGHPLTQAWTQAGDCNGTFSSAAELATDWTPAVEGQCRVTLTVTSNGLTASESLVLFVATNLGTVLVDGFFVPQPIIEAVGIQNPAKGVLGSSVCEIQQSSLNASCPVDLLVGQSLEVVVVSYVGGYADEAAVELSSSCGGTLTPKDSSSSGGGMYSTYTWVTPASGGLCELTAHVANEGMSDTFTVAVGVRSLACADDSLEIDSSIQLSTNFGNEMWPEPHTVTLTLVPNDDDWLWLAGLPPLDLLTVTSSNAAIPLEIYSLTFTQTDPIFAMIASGTGAASATPVSQDSYYYIRVMPVPGVDACASPHVLTILGTPP